MYETMYVSTSTMIGDCRLRRRRRLQHYRPRLIAYGLLVLIITAIVLLSITPQIEAKGGLKKLLKIKKLKKYLPFMLMGPKIIIINR